MRCVTLRLMMSASLLPFRPSASPQNLSRYTKTLAIADGIALFTTIALVQAQPPAQQGGRGDGGTAGAGRVGRFQNYSREAIDRGLPLYNSICSYCHDDRGKSGKAGRDRIASLVTLHEPVKIDSTDAQITDIADVPIKFVPTEEPYWQTT
jgi:hypothetical protein